MEELTLELALKMLEAAERWAKDIAAFSCSIAVVDKAGAVIAVHRMDGAAMATTDIAIEKAWTAVAFKMPTLMGSRWLDPRNMGKLIGDHAMGMIGRGKGRLCFIPGGIPITNEENEVISDTSVSQAGVTALYE
jgi:uncharacterized protein GlcG (DUF336 family)